MNHTLDRKVIFSFNFNKHCFSHRWVNEGKKNSDESLPQMTENPQKVADHSILKEQKASQKHAADFNCHNRIAL